MSITIKWYYCDEEMREFAQQMRNTPNKYYQNICRQTNYNFGGINENEAIDFVERNWIVKHEYITFLKSTHPRCIKSPAQVLAGIQPILQLILTFLILPRHKIKKISEVSIIGESMCTFAMCAIPNCPYSICTEHGWMEAIHEEGNEYTYDSRSCCEAGCEKQFCWKHYDHLPICDVCTGVAHAESSMGAYGYAGEYKLCPLHPPTKCNKVVGRDDDDTEYYHDEDLNADFELDDNGCFDMSRPLFRSDEEICEFYCCSNCINDHECGDDPREYL